MTAAWSGRLVQRARAIMVNRLPAPCGKCGKTVQPTEPWVVGHVVARWLRPDLANDPANWQPEHRGCSDASGQAEVIAKAKAAGAREALQRSTYTPRSDTASSQVSTGVQQPDFSHPTTTSQPPPRPFSPSGASDDPIVVRPGLEWDRDALAEHAWLLPYLDVPADASPPLWTSRPHHDAVGSYGAQAIAWIERAEKKTLRWWQQFAIVRQLEHRADGSLCHQTILESASRRSGKSVRIRGMALWRMSVGPSLFGERQEVVHTGSDIAVCRKAQKEAWRWAQAQDWTVTKGNGKEAIETPDGDTWLVRAQDATYGWDTTLALVDEAWDVKPETVDDGLEPSIMERSSAQLHMTSTAHRRARSTMRVRLVNALAHDDGETLVLVWAAPFDADTSLESTWRAASPHWTESRRRMIAGKYAKALSGEVDVEADDADPMAGFEAQYLNRWRLRARCEPPGEPIVTPEAWAELATLRPTTAPAAAAIESWFGDGVSLALSWRIEGCSVVSVIDHQTLEDCVAGLRASGFRGQVVVGASLMDDSALVAVRRRAGTGTVPAAVQQLARWIGEDRVRHDDGEHLTGQVVGARTVPGVNGPRVTSAGRADAIKAAAWSIQGTESPDPGKVRILTASVP